MHQSHRCLSEHCSSFTWEICRSSLCSHNSIIGRGWGKNPACSLSSPVSRCCRPLCISLSPNLCRPVWALLYSGLQFQRCSAVFNSQIDEIPPDSRLNLIRTLWYLTGSGKAEKKTWAVAHRKVEWTLVLIVKKHIDSGLNNGVED